MKIARPVLWAILLALISITFVILGVSLSLAESNATGNTPSQGGSLSPTWRMFTPPSFSATAPSPTPIVLILGSTSSVPTDTLAPSSDVTAGTTSVPTVPATSTLPTSTRTATRQSTRLPTATASPVPCGPPASWVVYVVQHGDSLYRLSQIYAVSIDNLQKANCMGDSTSLRTGQKLYVPPLATRPPLPTQNPATSTPTVYPTLPTSLP